MTSQLSPNALVVAKIAATKAAQASLFFMARPTFFGKYSPLMPLWQTKLDVVTP
ncbi:hypothetical protein ACKWRH_05060 [Bradyrhizobium sp. Pa8]|uniref:hypothetical protein n=1 Tax=Bradyrhizobium sp. Pa8 TaxID=3386552 RepID=UPI00403F918D